MLNDECRMKRRRRVAPAFIHHSAFPSLAFHRFEREHEVHVVADGAGEAFHAVVAALEVELGFPAGAVAHLGLRFAGLGHVEGDRLGDAVEREVAVELPGVARLFDLRRLEGDRRELGDVEVVKKS